MNYVGLPLPSATLLIGSVVGRLGGIGLDANYNPTLRNAAGTDVFAMNSLGQAVLGSSTAGFIPVVANYVASTVTNAIYVASGPVKVSSIIGRVRVAGSDGSAVTYSFYKAPSGTAIGSGTVLHTGTYNLKGTADTNQSLTLSSTAADLTLAAGDCIGLVLTGTATAAVGQVTITLTPL